MLPASACTSGSSNIIRDLRGRGPSLGAEIPNFQLQVGKQLVSPKSIASYRVEQVKSSSVEVISDGEGSGGWVPADQIVLVELGINFFTQQVRANPQDAFSYATTLPPLTVSSMIFSHPATTRLRMASSRGVRNAYPPRMERRSRHLEVGAAKRAQCRRVEHVP